MQRALLLAGMLAKASMPTCIFSGVDFLTAQREHILQSFLGASWVSRTIACDEVQQTFGRTIDAGVEATLRPIRVLLGTRGDRGGRNSRGEGLKGLVSTAGEIFDVEPGGRPRLAVPIVKAKRTESGHRVAITVSSEDQLDWAAHEASKLVSGYQLTSQEILSRGRRAPAFSQGEIPVPLAVHPLYQRGALKAAFNLLGACNASVALSGSCDEVRQFILSAAGEPSDFIRWSRAPGKPPRPTIGPVDHVIALYGKGAGDRRLPPICWVDSTRHPALRELRWAPIRLFLRRGPHATRPTPRRSARRARTPLPRAPDRHSPMSPRDFDS